MRDVRFSNNSFKEFSNWAIENKKAYQKLIELWENDVGVNLSQWFQQAW
jgi:hypothetical protein